MFYQSNTTKVEKIVYYTRFIRRTVTLVLLELLTAFVVPQPTRVTIKRLIIIYNSRTCHCESFSICVNQFSKISGVHLNVSAGESIVNAPLVPSTE
jgi:hypothetical protein